MPITAMVAEQGELVDLSCEVLELPDIVDLSRFLFENWTVRRVDLELSNFTDQMLALFTKSLADRAQIPAVTMTVCASIMQLPVELCRLVAACATPVAPLCIDITGTLISAASVCVLAELRVVSRVRMTNAAFAPASMLCSDWDRAYA